MCVCIRLSTIWHTYFTKHKSNLINKHPLHHCMAPTLLYNISIFLLLTYSQLNTKSLLYCMTHPLYHMTNVPFHTHIYFTSHTPTLLHGSQFTVQYIHFTIHNQLNTQTSTFPHDTPTLLYNISWTHTSILMQDTPTLDISPFYCKKSTLLHDAQTQLYRTPTSPHAHNLIHKHLLYCMTHPLYLMTDTLCIHFTAHTFTLQHSSFLWHCSNKITGYYCSVFGWIATVWLTD